MKKIFSTILAFAILGLSVQAQTKQEVKKPAPAKVETPKKPAASPTKADGTPDMRYKQNQKTVAAPVKVAGPTKADGTPDMRFKKNQTPTSTPKKKG